MYEVDPVGISNRIKELFEQHDDAGTQTERLILLRQIAALHDLLNSVVEMQDKCASGE
jgi:hypothetical protein